MTNTLLWFLARKETLPKAAACPKVLWDDLVRWVPSSTNHCLSCICYTSVTSDTNSSVFNASWEGQGVIFGGSCWGKHSATHLAVGWFTHTLLCPFSNQPMLSRLPLFSISSAPLTALVWHEKNTLKSQHRVWDFILVLVSRHHDYNTAGKHTKFVFWLGLTGRLTKSTSQ